MSDYLYAAINEAVIYESVVNNKGRKPINRILMGTYVKIEETSGDWLRVTTAGPDGWMRRTDLAEKMGLKVFFLDVGQGDGILLEIGSCRILIDAGPNNNMYRYLTAWQYSYLLKANQKVHIDYLVVSHFDMDHYKGFIPILNDQRFTFGTVIHPGILKFASSGNPYSTGLGDTLTQGGVKYLLQVFDDLLTTQSAVPFNRDITAFMRALDTARQQGRVSASMRCRAGDVILNRRIDGHDFRIDVLGPFTETVNQAEAFVYWKDDGITINGHSLVLKLTYGTRSILLGGDLNTASEEYLMGKYGHQHPFESDVAKSCHHGSSDFTEQFMSCINPYATVISSGDNESHAHPRADAIGCAGKYSKSARPLVYSTELARSTNLKNQEILYGMINLRCNGTDIYMSQMKEAKNNADVWDSYRVQ